MADNQMVKIVFDFDLGNVPASAKKLSQYLKDNSLDLKFTKASVDGLSASLNQLATAQTKAEAATTAAGNSVKKSNMQWTHLALIVQDLPYGFRGIQNNLPALIGGFAGMTGAIYLASSVIIALFTAWDNGMISFGKSSKMAEDYSKGLATTYSTEIVKLKALYNISTDVTKSMGSRLEAAKALKEEYPGLLGKYSDEDIALGKAKSSYDKLTTTIINYSRAKAAEGILTGIAAERLPLEIERTELLAKQRKAAGKDIEYTITSEGKRVAIGNKSVRLLKENAEAQAKINKKAAPYVKILEDTAIAEIELEKFRAKAAKGKTSVGTLEDPNIKLLQAKQKYYKDDLLMSASFEQEILGKQRDLAVKQAELEKKNGTYIQTIRDTYNQLILNSQAETGRKIIEEQHKLGVEENKEHEKIVKEQEKRDKEAYALLVANKNRELQNTLDAIKIESDAKQRLHKKSASLTQQDLMDEKEALLEVAAAGFYTAEQFDKIVDAMVRVDAKIKGSATVWEETTRAMDNTIKSFITDSLFALGESIGKVFAGENVDAIDVFGTLIADALQSLGKQLIAFGVAKLAAWEALKNPTPAGAALAVAAGIAAVAAGAALKSSLTNAKSTESNFSRGKNSNMPRKFADGGIISGPTYGLMGEYPGAKSNPEVVAPLDKLKDMIGGGGAGTFMLRGQDLLLSVNRAQKASNLKGQNISLA
jgi:hypothetical protein